MTTITNHPDAGRVCHLFSRCAELHGQRALILDWVENVHRANCRYHTLASGLIARTQSAARPPTREDIEHSNQRYVVVCLQDLRHALVHRDEIFFFKRSHRVDSLVHSTRFCIEGLAIHINGMVLNERMPLKISTMLEEMVRQLQDTGMLLSREDLLSTVNTSGDLATISLESDAASLAVVVDNARSIHRLLSEIIDIVTTRYREVLLRSVRYKGNGTSADYFEQFGPNPAHDFEPELKSAAGLRQKLLDLRHHSGFNHSPAIKATTCQLVDCAEQLEIAAEAHILLQQEVVRPRSAG